MESFLERPATLADSGAISSLLNRLSRSTGSARSFTEPQVRTYFDGFVGDLAGNTKLIHSPDGNLVAAGYLAPPPTGGTVITCSGGVLPGFRRLGIGRAILAWQLDRAETLHGLIAPNELWRARGGAEANDHDTIHLYDRFGLRPVRHFLYMTARLDRDPAASAPPGVRAKLYENDFGEPLYELHNDVFADGWEFQPVDRPTWRARTVDTPHFRPDLSRLGLAGDDIVGYVLSYESKPGRVYIGQVGTHRAWRRAGVASWLLATALAASRAAGFTEASLGVDADNETGAVGVYQRLGFDIATRSAAYDREIPQPNRFKAVQAGTSDE
jgi:ribosomal protein S18 acetylase RimI-like enzyme